MVGFGSRSSSTSSGPSVPYTPPALLPTRRSARLKYGSTSSYDQPGARLPAVVVGAVPRTHICALMRGRPAEDPAARPVQLAVGQFRLRGGGVVPVEGGLEQLGERRREVDLLLVVGTPASSRATWTPAALTGGSRARSPPNRRRRSRSRTPPRAPEVSFTRIVYLPVTGHEKSARPPLWAVRIVRRYSRVQASVSTERRIDSISSKSPGRRSAAGRAG